MGLIAPFLAALVARRSRRRSSCRATRAAARSRSRAGPRMPRSPRGPCSGSRRRASRRAGSLAVPAVAGGDARSRRPTWRSSRWPRRRSAPDPAALLARLQARRSTGRIGPTVNSTCWAVLALGASSKQTTRWLLAHQAKSGGFSWAIGGQPDSNDTAAALEALRVAGVHGAPVTQGGSVPAQLPAPGRRLRADPRPRLRRAVDRLGDPGARRRRAAAAAERVRLPRAAEAPGRQLPLLGEVRDDPGLGHVTGPRRARPQAVPPRVGIRPAGRPGCSRACC